MYFKGNFVVSSSLLLVAISNKLVLVYLFVCLFVDKICYAARLYSAKFMRCFKILYFSFSFFLLLSNNNFCLLYLEMYAIFLDFIFIFILIYLSFLFWCWLLSSVWNSILLFFSIMTTTTTTATTTYWKIQTNQYAIHLLFFRTFCFTFDWLYRNPIIKITLNHLCVNYIIVYCFFLSFVWILSIYMSHFNS